MRQADLIDILRARVAERPTDSTRATEASLPASLSEPEFEEILSTLPMTASALFQTLYTQVADGGFGPGSGLLSFSAVAAEAGDMTLPTLYRNFSHENEWPKTLLPVVDWGCGIWTCIEFDEDRERGGRLFTLCHEGLFRTQYTLQSWLEAWLQGVSIWHSMLEFEDRLVVNPHGHKAVSMPSIRAVKGSFVSDFFAQLNG